MGIEARNIPHHTALYAIGSNPLGQWDTHVDPRAGAQSTVERIMDEDLKSSVIDIRGVSVATTSVQCPRRSLGPWSSLGVSLPCVSFLIKSMGADVPCSIELHVQDSKKERRRLRASTFQKRATSDSKVAALPLRLNVGWNHVQFDLREFLQKWYSTTYEETIGIEVHGTCRLRKIYFTDALYSGDELPPEFRLSLSTRRRCENP
jgi:hypothetical protein